MAEGLKTDNGMKVKVAKQNICVNKRNPFRMKLNGEELNNVDNYFRYLGSVIYTDGTIGRDVDLLVRAGWSSWRNLTGVLYEDSPQTESESIRCHNQTGSDVWKRILGDNGEQQEEDCYHGDEDAPQDPRSVEKGSQVRRTWKDHISSVRSTLLKTVGILYRVRHLLNRFALFILYCSLFLPYLTYCAEIWGNTYKSNTQCIFLVQKNIVRNVCGVYFEDYPDSIFQDFF